MWRLDTVLFQIDRAFLKIKNRNIPILPRGCRIRNISDNQKTYLNSPINPYLIFISYWNKSRILEEMLELLECILDSSDLRDYVIAWEIKTDAEIMYLKEKLGERAQRIRFVARDRVEYCKTLEVASMLIVASTMPEYYIRREGQTLIKVTDLSSMLVNTLTKTCTYADGFDFELQDCKNGVFQEHGIQKPNKHISCSFDSNAAAKKEVEPDKKIVFSYKRKWFRHLLKNPAAFEEWMRSNRFFFGLLGSCSFKVIIPDETPTLFEEHGICLPKESSIRCCGIRSLVKQNTIFVTDKITEVFTIIDICESVVFVRAANCSPLEIELLNLAKEYVNIYEVNNHDAALKLLRTVKWSAEELRTRQTIHDDAPTLFDAICCILNKGVEPEHRGKMAL